MHRIGKMALMVGQEVDSFYIGREIKIMASTVIVSGAAGNLGQAMVRQFLQEGFQVLGFVAPGDPTDKLPSHELLDIISADLTNEKETGDIISAAVKKYGTIEVAILTVGGFAMGSIEDTSLEDIEKQIKLNFNTAYSVVRPLFRKMQENGRGRIFLTGSGPGMNMQKSKGMVAYGLSKSLLFRLAELLNEESDGKDIITQVIVPSTIDTPQNRKAMPEADFSKWVKPESIARDTFNALKNISENRRIVF